MFCRGSGNESPTGPCDSGFLCLGGASAPAPTDGVTGAPCPRGFYCPAGSYSAVPCPKGTFSERSGLGEQSECQRCSPGFYCAEPGLTAVSGPCLSGFFCLEGSPDVTPVAEGYGDLCPPGHYCENGTAAPAACPAGTHRPQTGGRGRQDCVTCPAGWFQDHTGQTECKPCPARFYCPSPHQEAGGVVTPVTCPQGYFCPGDAPLDSPVPCPRGTYSSTEGLSTADECWVCPAGHFCGSDGLTQPTGPCAAGFLCHIRAVVPNPVDDSTGSLCPPGAFCQAGIIAGECSPGYYCSGGSTSPEGVLCPAGFYCPKGSHTPFPCEAGTFSSAAGNSHRGNCTSCLAGFFCQGEGVVQPEICPSGHFCPPGTSLAQQFPCPPGTLLPLPGATSPEDCLLCPAGLFCALPGLSEPTGPCQEGFHCSPGSSSPNGTGITMQMESDEGSICPTGFYCPVGTSYPVPCPPGTFSSTPGLTRAEQCQPCPGGLWCGRAGMTQIADALLCEGRYVCVGGSVSPRPGDGIMGYLCPPGHSCPAGSALEVPCEAGTYSSSSGAANCSLCPAGTMCPSDGMQEPALCPLGHFCPVGTALPLPCPTGTLGQMAGAPSQASCSPCPTGHYCNSPGASQPQGRCEQGYFCQGGASSLAPQPSAELPQNGPCPTGHYCPPGTLSPLPCPTGTVRNLTGGVSIESCFSCPGGYYCDGEGLDTPSGPCDAGFYCPSDSSSTTPHTFMCTKGHFCPQGSPLPLPCPTGQYQPTAGSDSCIPCRPGFYCEQAVVGDPLACPPHTFCPAATMVPQPCPDGTFTPPGQGGLREERECLSCPPGRYCRAGQIKGVCAAGYLCVSGSSEFTPLERVLAEGEVCEWGVQCAGACPAGFYCEEGTERAMPCPDNTVRSSPGASSLSDCLPCPPTHWCREGGAVLHACPVGHYCDGVADYESGGRPGPRKCPVFTYRPTPSAGSKGDCHPCPPGTFCNSTGLSHYSGLLCPPGFWCSGSSPPVPCPAGTFRAQPGAADVTQCEPCDPGTYCPDPRATGVPNTAGIPCRASYQCPAGSAQETLCLAGFYCGPQTGEPPPCPLGYMCPQGSHTHSSPQQQCSFPFFCPVGSSAKLACPGGFMPVNSTGLRASLESSCVPCQAGTYRPALASVLQCQPCPPGYHCPAGAESPSSHPCPAGYFCPPGSASPLPCPPGFYGNRTNLEAVEECQTCPASTFNHLPAQTACFPCGSSATSVQGSSSCSCIGRKRAFQPSDGSCLCQTGFVFYNQLDFKSSSADSRLDCQPEVSKRCGGGEVRLASSQECVCVCVFR
ncbi:multiple epidermal growth factor-like domains protein 6 [Clupea harengus]|uniref:Multiple epidermal growth factor-like domains protein 6 n=1 Tax=Clupea harengus TaxID=7950 RepID=A0A8M1KU54_CLUHA|nr:multiple epidermal growth factor-like domains protein 6 [Clupea harengus]